MTKTELQNVATKRNRLLNVVGLIWVFFFTWVVTGYIPAFPLFQGRVVIGRVPLFAAWWSLRWVEMGLHVLLAASVTGIFVIAWCLGINKGRFSIKMLLLLMTLVAVAVATYATLTGSWAFRNGSQLL